MGEVLSPTKEQKTMNQSAREPPTHVAEGRLKEKRFEKTHAKAVLPVAAAALHPGLGRQHRVTMHQRRGLPRDSQDPECTVPIPGL